MMAIVKLLEFQAFRKCVQKWNLTILLKLY